MDISENTLDNVFEKPYIIAVSGGSGCGKTTFVKQLLVQLGIEKASLLSMDNYYKPKLLQTKDKNGIENYDLPSAIDYQLFINDLTILLSGKTIELVEYNFNNPKFQPKKITIEYRKIIIIEGVFVYYFEELKKLFDLKIFIHTTENIRIKRRLIRDLEERNYTINETLYYIENHVTPGYKKYIEPHSDSCDLIIPNNDNFEKSIDLLCAYLRMK